MVIQEYETEHPRQPVFFQGSREPWRKYIPSVEGLARRSHVMPVTPDGHDPEEHSDFISVDKTVDDTFRWLKEHEITHLFLIKNLNPICGQQAKVSRGACSIPA